MNELQAFRTALREAGQPWSRWGIRLAGAGVVALLALQLLPSVPYAVYDLVGVVALIATGWAMLIVAVVKRRRWAKDHPWPEIPSSDVFLGDAP